MDLNDTPRYAAADTPPPSLPATPAQDDADARLVMAQRELVTLIARLTEGIEGSLETGIEGVAVHRIANPSGPKHAVQKPPLQSSRKVQALVCRRRHL